ncbi:MAG: ATP-binding cassette domain-containing protein, partial [Pseudomonadota bacterium]
VSLRQMGKEQDHKTMEKLAARFKSEAVPDTSLPHIEVKNLRKEFYSGGGGWFGAGSSNTFVAVDDVSFEIKRGECLGLVGESGSGKTTVSKLIMHALQPTNGSVRLNTAKGPLDVFDLKGDALMDFRRRVQMIFQDPFSSLNPRMTVQNILREPLAIHKVGDEASQQADIVDLMSLVGLDPRFLNRYPHSFSGGQRQRVGIARALALHPEMMICDEPVSALDVSVQAQILNLLNDLRSELGLTSLFISHNLAVVNYVAERIAVMCQGKLVELATREQLFKNPRHPYTRSLLASVPYPDIDRLLDFEKFKFESSHSGAAWGDAFTASENGKLMRMEVEQGHFVLANENSDLRELIA